MSYLSKEVEKLFKERFPEPTEIQKKAFPEVASGRNVLIVAPTGYGKTEAALLPILSKILEDNPPSIAMLYITPLRALNRDIFERTFWWAKKLGITVGLRHGDTKQSERGKQAKEPPKILVTTPETLQSILPAKRIGKHLANVKWVVVDELHELIESKRGSQLVLALERLADRAKFQRIGISATIGDPDKAMNFLGLEKKITLAKQRKIDITVESPRPNQDDKRTGEALGLHPSAVARLRRIHELVEDHGAVLTFVNTRSMAELLASRYLAWDKRHNISVHHSSLSRDVRLLAEKKFKGGKIKGLIATSSLELGIDIGRVDLVIQYMSPRQVTRLVQRIGRSGHSIEKRPRGVIIAGDEEDTLESGVIAELAKKGELEELNIPEKPLDVLAHQIVGLSLDIGRVKLDYAFNLVRRAYPYHDLTWTEFLDVLKTLDEERLIWLNDDSYKARRKAYVYYFSNLSTIPDEKKLWVKNRISGKNVGVLDEIFVSDHLYLGAVFITKGSPWKVIDITENEVIVEPASDFTAAIPDWVGEEIPVSTKVANEVSLRWKNPPKEIVDRKAILKFASKLEFIPTPNKIYVEEVPGTTVIHSPYGNKVNETLAELIAGHLSMKYGRSINKRVDAYRIGLDARADDVIGVIKEIDPNSVETMLSSYLSRSSSFKSRFIHVAKRFGLLAKDVDYSRISIRRIISAMINSPVYTEAMKEVFFDKMDIQGTKKLLIGIQKGSVRIERVKRKQFSKLASFLSSGTSYFLAEKPTEEIVEIVKERLMNTYVSIECMNCGRLMYRKVKDYPDKIVCQCGGRMFFIPDYPGDKVRVATLIREYGKRALMVLAGKGIGPETAARILASGNRGKRLVEKIIDAERKFIRTHRFWRS